MNPAIKVALAETDEVICSRITGKLKRESGLVLTGEVLSAGQLLGMIDSAEIDVSVLSASLAGEETVRLVQTLTERSPIKVLILGQSLTAEQILEFLKAGASGYLSYDSPAGNLVKAISAIHRGEMWAPRQLMAQFFKSVHRSGFQKKASNAMYAGKLTKREREILGCLQRGQNNKSIASQLCISEMTVKTHLQNIFRKLNISGRLQAVVNAAKEIELE